MKAIGMMLMFAGLMIFCMSFVMFKLMVQIDDEDKKDINRIMNTLKFATRMLAVVLFGVGAGIYFLI